MREALAFIKTRNEEKFMCSVMGYIGSRIPKEEFKLGFDMTVSRGPDMSRSLTITAFWDFTVLR